MPSNLSGLASSVLTYYAGREYDSYTDLYYNRARWYDAAMQRFISEDPIGFAAGLRGGAMGGMVVFATQARHNGGGAPIAVRPSPKTSLSGRVTGELPAGKTRTPAEVKQARNFFERNREAARQWWEQRTGKPWPKDAVHDAHPGALKDGGDPLLIEPSYRSSNAEHMVPRPEHGGLTDAQRWGRMGGRPKKQ